MMVLMQMDVKMRMKKLNTLEMDLSAKVLTIDIGVIIWTTIAKKDATIVVKKIVVIAAIGETHIQYVI